jgi:aconitate hydratase
MGVIPLQFLDGQSWKSLGLTGAETVSIDNVATLGPRQNVMLKVVRPGGAVSDVEVRCRIDTENEVEYFRNGGILHYVLRGLARA